MPMIKASRIDAHVHLWHLARGDYDWMTPELDKLYRDFTPQDLKPNIDDAGIDAVILVQAAATVAETQFLLDIADKIPFVAGVVGWVDVEAPDVEATLDELCRNTHFKGIRPMIHDIPDVDWMLKESLKKGFQAVIERDLTFDCLVRPVHLKNLHRLLTTLPDLRAIIDHCAKPDIAGNCFQGWARDIKNLAQDTTAYCKLCGLMRAVGGVWISDNFQPYIDHIITCFGRDGIFW